MQVNRRGKQENTSKAATKNRTGGYNSQRNPKEDRKRRKSNGTSRPTAV